MRPRTSRYLTSQYRRSHDVHDGRPGDRQVLVFRLASGDQVAVRVGPLPAAGDALSLAARRHGARSHYRVLAVEPGSAALRRPTVVRVEAVAAPRASANVRGVMTAANQERMWSLLAAGMAQNAVARSWG